MISGGLDDLPKFSAEEYVRWQTILEALGDFFSASVNLSEGLEPSNGKGWNYKHSIDRHSR
jgi:hypothetical protein